MFLSIIWLRSHNTKKSGKTHYRAEIRIAKNGSIVHQESETFDKKTLAKAWATKREAEVSAQKRIMGIVEVQEVTLHESWKTLQRYVNFNPDDVDI